MQKIEEFNLGKKILYFTSREKNAWIGISSTTPSFKQKVKKEERRGKNLKGGEKRNGCSGKINDFQTIILYLILLRI